MRKFAPLPFPFFDIRAEHLGFPVEPLPSGPKLVRLFQAREPRFRKGLGLFPKFIDTVAQNLERFLLAKKLLFLFGNRFRGSQHSGFLFQPVVFRFQVRHLAFRFRDFQAILLHAHLRGALPFAVSGELVVQVLEFQFFPVDFPVQSVEIFLVVGYREFAFRDFRLEFHKARLVRFLFVRKADVRIVQDAQVLSTVFILVKAYGKVQFAKPVSKSLPFGSLFRLLLVLADRCAFMPEIVLDAFHVRPNPL